MREKFLLLTRHCDRAAMARLVERLQNLEAERQLDWIKVESVAKRPTKPRPRAPTHAHPARRRTKKK